MHHHEHHIQLNRTIIGSIPGHRGALIETGRLMRHYRNSIRRCSEPPANVYRMYKQFLTLCMHSKYNYIVVYIQ